MGNRGVTEPRDRSIVWLAVLSISAGCAGCYHPAGQSVPTPSLPPADQPATARLSTQGQLPTGQEATNYVGDRACAGCHDPIARTFETSAHATSLQWMDGPKFRPLFSTGQRIRDDLSGSLYHPGYEQGRALVLRESAGEKSRIVERLAVGSGRKGLTFLGQDEKGEWVVSRISYYTRVKRWDFSPDLSPDRALEHFHFVDPEGRFLDLRGVAFCISCHATTLTMGKDGPDAKHSYLGIGCERCHGPGKQHVEFQLAPASTKPAIHFEDLVKATPDRISALCGSCHDAQSDQEGDGFVSARFESTNLKRSACYIKSGTLSCTSCHNPHEDASTGNTPYEKVCLSCHQVGAAGGHDNARNRAGQAATICKVNPRTGCIGCHMPTAGDPDFPYSRFFNHWIKVWSPSAAAAPAPVS